MDFMWTIFFYEWQKEPAAALITLLFLILKSMCLRQCVLITEEESGIFTIESSIHLGVTDALSAFKSFSWLV